MRHLLRLLLVFIFTSAYAWASGDPATSANTTINLVNRTPAAATPAKGLHFAPDPPNAGQVIAAAVQQLQHTNFNGANVPAVDVDPPLAIYSLTDINGFLASGNLESVAKLTAYSFDLKVSGKWIAKIQTPLDGTTGEVRLSTIYYSVGAATGNITGQAASIAKVQAGSYEARELDFTWHGGRRKALWLKSSPDEGDLICTNFMPIDGLKEGTLYTTPDFVAALQGAQAATPYEVNKRKAANGEDTTTTRLTTLQTSLETALADLKKKSTGSLDQTIADVTRAQTDVAQGLEYLKTHPGGDRLVTQDAKYSVQRRWRPSELGYGSINNNPDLKMADDLSRALVEFIGNPVTGRPSMGDVGGVRDAIMRDVATAACDYIVAMRPGVAPVTGTKPLSAIPVGNSLALGSISGAVEVRFPPNSNVPPTVPYPAAFVYITLIGMDPHLSARDGQLIPGEIPVTLSDETGTFTIRNLPPGLYSVNAGGGRVVVEVKAGAETKITESLVARIMGVGGG